MLSQINRALYNLPLCVGAIAHQIAGFWSMASVIILEYDRWPESSRQIRTDNWSAEMSKQLVVLT